MARHEWCRAHIDEVAAACDLGDKTVYKVKQASKFTKEHSQFCDLPTAPILALIRVQDEQVRERAILHAQNKLNRQTPTGGQHTKTLTEKDIKKIIENAEIEVRKEMMEQIRIEREENKTNGSVIKEITQEEVDKLLESNPEQTPDAEPENPPEKTVPAVTITQKEIDIYFTVMKKILCDEDIPKHKRRMDMMIENKTLVVVG